MIVAKTTIPTEKEFIEFIKKISDDAQSFLLSGKLEESQINGNGFEELVFKIAICCSKDTLFEDKLYRTADREFPDIVAHEYYGIEVKFTDKDKWTSIGNSVLESSRIKGVEKIYVLFGKFAGKPEVMFKKYQDCLSGISVTHWPRYQIDMKLKDGDSIFDKMKVDYETLCADGNPISYIRKYYKENLKEGESLWWIDDSAVQETNLSPIIRNLKDIPVEDKTKILADLFVVFPEVFGNSINKYEAIPGYLVSKYGVVTANLRDWFSAGGTVEFIHEGKKYAVPQVVGKMLEMAKIISGLFADKKQEKAWLNLVSNYLKDLPIIDIYKAKIVS